MPKTKNSASVYDESVIYCFYKTLTTPFLRPKTLQCIARIFYNFFFRQYRAAWLPGRVPVTNVDHRLDQKIPFIPAWVTIYLDFVSFWIRMLTFLLRTYGRRSFPAVREFIESMGRLYLFAAEAYSKNFSTTTRPFYIARPRFLVIHLLDPHLMCIPSLHVMVVIWTYSRFAAILRSLGEEEKYLNQIEEMQQGALAISQAILYVKQHSVNCIPAALYAMTCFDAEMFPREKAESFTALLFGDPPSARPPASNSGKKITNYKVRPYAAPATKLPTADIAEIKAHIIKLYRHFLAEGETAKSWEEPLLHFLQKINNPALKD